MGERERKKTDGRVCGRDHFLVYVYVFVLREREREREKEICSRRGLVYVCEKKGGKRHLQQQK